MNKDLSLNLDIKDLKALLPFLQKYASVLVGLALIGLFGYTGWVINRAMNVQAAATKGNQSQVTFNQTTINTLKTLQIVPGIVPSVPLGTSDPFGQ